MASWKKLLTVGDVQASDISSGTISVDRIPDLTATKITSGTIPDARLPGDCGARTTYDNYSSFKAASSAFDSGGSINSGTKLTIQGGSNITTSRSGSAITVNGTADTNTNQLTTWNLNGGSTSSVAHNKTVTINGSGATSVSQAVSSGNHVITISSANTGDTTYGISTYDNAPAGGIVFTPSTGSATTIEFTDGDLYYDTDGDNIEAKIMDGVIDAGKLDSSAVTTTKIQNNAVTPAKANLGWHTQTKIFITPSDFIINDDNNYGNLAMVDSGGQAKVMYDNLEAYTNYIIPSGYKVTHFRVNGTSSIPISARYSTVASSSTTSVQTFGVSTYTNNTYATNPTSGISADDTNGRYFILGWLPTSKTNQYLYGAVLTIAKI